MVSRISMFTILAAILVASCQQRTPPEAKSGIFDKGEKVAEKTKHDHWWCEEHGIPEAECSMCNPKFAAKCKKAGDWCEQHDRAKSQCFQCDPSLKEKFAALYVAKYGKKPPEPIE
jgi:hypothetical protein